MMLHYVFIAWPNHYALVFILKGMCGTCTNSRTWNQCRESTCRIITKSAANGTMCLIRDVPVRFRVYSVAGGGGPRGDGRSLVSGRPLATAAGVPQPRTCSDPGTPTGPLGTW